MGRAVTEPLDRSCVVRDGHLFLSLMADGGIYELEPATKTRPSGVEQLLFRGQGGRVLEQMTQEVEVMKRPRTP